MYVQVKSNMIFLIVHDVCFSGTTKNWNHEEKKTSNATRIKKMGNALISDFVSYILGGKPITVTVLTVCVSVVPFLPLI